MPLLTSDEWGSFLSAHPHAHILQTTAWGDLKSRFGWTVFRIQCGSIAAQILIRKLALGFNIAYLPKGPIGGEKLFVHNQEPQYQIWDEALNQFMEEIDSLCRAQRCIFLKIEPDIWQITPHEHRDVHIFGFRNSGHAIQPPRTIVMDLRGSEEQILDRMKQKTRYNIRLASKKGVRVYPSTDIAAFTKILDITSRRDGFGVHSLDYYACAYNIFYPLGECELFMSEYEGQILAGLMVFAHGNRAWYFYGGSSEIKRELMPNYLLQWEAIRWARSRGCNEYDLWGIPDYDETTLENNFLKRSDGLWGVYRFKRGFGGKICRSMGPFDRVYNLPVYQLYNAWMMRRSR